MCAHNKIKKYYTTYRWILSLIPVYFVAQQHTGQQTMKPEAPIITVYLPELQIYLSPNTFIMYRRVAEGEEKVGLILSVNPEQYQQHI